MPVDSRARERGRAMSGSDIRDSSGLATLAELGVQVFSGYEAGHLPVEASAVVVTHAVSDDNLEFLRAQELCFPVVHRSMAVICYADCHPRSWNPVRHEHATSRRKRHPGRRRRTGRASRRGRR